MEVKVYSTPNCPWCKRAGEFLKGNGVAYTDVNVAGNHDAAQEMIKKSGQMGVPVIEIDGKVIVGFDEEELRKTLRIRG
jgi:glutaredoxin 3